MLHVVQSSVKRPIRLRLAAPWWTKQHRIAVNGKQTSARLQDGFISATIRLQSGDTVLLNFELVSGWRETINPHSIKGYRCLHAGPVMLGCNTESEIALRGDSNIEPDGKGRYRAEPYGMNLERINDLNDLDVPPTDSCRRQVLFRA